MNYAHIHLFLNHLPFIGLLISFLFLSYYLLKEKYDAVKPFLFMVVLLSIITVPVFLTGDSAEETLKNLPGIQESIIDSHENAAWITFAIMMAIGVLSIAALYLMQKTKNIAAWFRFFLLFLMLAALISFARTALFGGQIRHTELITINLPADTE